LEVTLESISLIVIALTSIIVVGSIVFEVLPTQMKVMEPGIMVRVEDAEFSLNRTWFILSITSDNEIQNITVMKVNGTVCNVSEIAYTERTIKVFGYCEGNLKGDVVVIAVRAGEYTFQYNAGL